MNPIVLLVVFFLSTFQSANAENLWLVIGASDQTAAGIARKAQSLASHFPNSLVVQTADCGEKKNVFAWIFEVSLSAESAQAALSRIRVNVKDAYVKHCDEKAGTLLALRINAVDMTIANVPADVANWADKDRISSVFPLADGLAIVIVRYFSGTINDPLEGRRERVILIESPNKRFVLEEDCITPKGFVKHHKLVAFQCVREQAGDYLFHSVVVYDTSGKKVAELQRCRDPSWSDDRTIVCMAESVRPDGQIDLHSKQLDLVNETQ